MTQIAHMVWRIRRSWHSWHSWHCTTGTVGIAHVPVHHGTRAQVGAVPAAPGVVNEPVVQIVTAAHAAHVALDGGGAPIAAEVRTPEEVRTPHAPEVYPVAISARVVSVYVV